MPRGDRTGPLGLGPMTGRAGGYCAGYGIPGYLNRFHARGSRGGGRGWRHWYYATGLPGWMRWGGHPAWPYYGPPAGPQAEVNLLREQAKTLQSELEDIERRIQELESAEGGPQEG